VRITVLGVGLIGGSVALGARERLGASVTGYDDSPEALERALQRGAVTCARSSVADAVADAEAVFVAIPVGGLSALVGEALAAAPADCVVTDVGSTKRGVQHARADLFQAATWYLTPSSVTSGVLYERLHRLLHGLGARPTAIDAETHDRILAAVSHLPHVFANVLVGQAAATLAGDDARLPATGPSFRDATRVAGAPSAIWSDIYVSNRDALTAEIDGAVERLRAVRAALADGDRDAITAWNEAAGADRRRLLESQLAGGDQYELRASVPNRPGVVAQIALELGRAGVNITDMALYPANDMKEGVVALWIGGEQPAQRAQELIGDLGFPVARQ
jgi:prephenate dehydrogenase